jgi:FMN phosphatase YigB (HAD superfamily)
VTAVTAPPPARLDYQASTASHGGGTEAIQQTLIFDLDNCLAASNEPGDDLYQPVFTAVRAATEGAVPEPKLAAAFDDLWFDAFDVVAERYGFTDAMREAGWRAFLGIEVRTPIRGYGDMGELPHLGDRRFLVTSGFRRLQESKVRALGIAPLFEAVVIDAIEEPGHRGKERIFADLVAERGLDRRHVVAVGDNPESELEAGRRLGFRAVQIVRPRVEPADGYDQVRGLKELRRWLGFITA